MAKSTSTRRESLREIRERSGAPYYAKKLRSPVPTPRKLKNHVTTKSNRVRALIKNGKLEQRYEIFIDLVFITGT